MLRKNSQLRAVGVLVAGLVGAWANGLAAQDGVNPFTAEVDIETGQSLFARQCAVCHGFGARGGEVGPDLTTGNYENASTDAALFNVISEGIPNTAMIGINRGRTDQSVWQIVAYLRSLSGDERVAVTGDASNGERLFRGSGNCLSCHMVNGEGGRQGPDLSTIGGRRTPAQLLSDLVDPDARVQPRWWTMRVMHLDGTFVEGLRMDEGTYSVRILDGNDNLWSFMKRDLRDSERIETSSMPASSGLTENELDDLVAYLYGLTNEQ